MSNFDDHLLTYSISDFITATEEIIEAANFLYSQGWTPATSSNFSSRLNENYCAITVSGKHKGRLTPDDVMVVDLEGKPQENKKPSAETMLHTSLYAWDNSINAILHTHSINSTLISLSTNDSIFRLDGYELHKAFAGIDTHESIIEVPIFDNTQDIPHLAEKVINYLKTGISCWGYLIKGHGIYVWGEDMDSALKHLEAIEYLMKCELELMRLRK